MTMQFAPHLLLSLKRWIMPVLSSELESFVRSELCAYLDYSL